MYHIICDVLFSVIDWKVFNGTDASCLTNLTMRAIAVFYFYFCKCFLLQKKWEWNLRVSTNKLRTIVSDENSAKFRRIYCSSPCEISEVRCWTECEISANFLENKGRNSANFALITFAQYCSKTVSENIVLILKRLEISQMSCYSCY